MSFSALLADEVGPRRPCSPAERRAAELVAARLRDAGADGVRTEPFHGLPTFSWPQAIPLLAALLARPGRPGSRIFSAFALGLAAAEADPRRQPLTRIFCRHDSQNVVGWVESSEPATRTLCLVSHLDSSRSGLLFHPKLAPRLRSVIAASSVALFTRSLALALGAPRLRPVAKWAAVPIVAALALLLERELRGEDVPGANDNASGVAVALATVLELASAPLRTTRVVFLATGCEESGTVGMRSFLERNDTEDWLFLNLDGVGASATLRYLPREGVGRTWPADPGLLRIARELAESRPELGLAPADRLVGLTYDVTQVLAAGGRAMTISAQDASIPNYHTPEDSAENLDAGVITRAQQVVRELVHAVDRGEADAP